MIRVEGRRDSDYQAREAQIRRIRTLPSLQEYYSGLCQLYRELNDKYLFSESFSQTFVEQQVDRCWSHRDEPLFAIPFGVKDVFNTYVLPTAMGSEIWKGFKAGNNARVVDEMVSRGGIVFSKTTTAEFAVHHIQAGKTLNPRDQGRITGTSSAGSAVAVACGALPIAFGTQTGGSIIRPASFCGTYGFKPSFGAYDRTGTLKTTDTLDTIGLLGSDIYGIRSAFAATFQSNPQYPFARRYFDARRDYHAKTVARVGVLDQQFLGFANYDRDIQIDFSRFVDGINNDRIVVRSVKDVEFINEVHTLHYRIYCKSLSYYFQQEAKSGLGVSSVMEEMIAAGSEVSIADYLDALEKQPQFRSKFDEVFVDHDFIITPSTATVAPVVGQAERDDTCLIWTFLGYPVVSIPIFWSDDNGLPSGLQIIGPRYSDMALLDFADYVVEQFR